MKTLGVLGAVLAISAGVFYSARHSETLRSGTDEASLPVQPVLVELFTSEGCSSCPPADALLRKLDEQQKLGNAEIIALEEHVDYWDQLGWRDPFSSNQWTQRQEDYAAAFRNDGVYTPQMVVDGRSEFVGSSQSRARSAIAEAAREPKTKLALTNQRLNGDKLAVEVAVQTLPDGGSRTAQVWLAVTENGLHSNVLRGENRGEDLHHAAVVRSLRKVGEAAAGRDVSFAGQQEIRIDPAWKKENVRIVAFVQDARSKRVLGATSVRLQP